MAERNHSTDARDSAPNAEARQVIRHDMGGWISGGSQTIEPTKADVAEPVRAEHIQAGDILLLDDGTHAEVDDVRHGIHHFPEGRAHGVAIGWQEVGGNSSGVLFRKADDTLARLPGGKS